jgi:hypothetical protein
LEKAYAADLPSLEAKAIEFAAAYDADHVFDTHWRPYLKTLEPPAPDPKPKMEHVDVIVPMMRPENLERLIRSFQATAPDTAWLKFVHDKPLGRATFGNKVIKVSEPGLRYQSAATKQEVTTYAEKVNLALRELCTADWVLIIGDDVEFTEGWFEAAQAISDRFDVIGTNDSEEGRIRNPLVGLGRHADHFFVRRSYIDDEGACLDGPGHLMPTAYKHWYTDKEVIELAKARGVYGHAHDCRIIHHHPGYDGREDLREADPVYMRAVDFSEKDHKTFLSRVPLIENHRLTRAS